MGPSSNMATASLMEKLQVVEKFEGENFHLWKFKMKMVLEERDLWDIVSGDEQRPEDSAGAVAFNKRSKKALATICLSLANSQLLQVRHCTAPEEAWRVLERLYENKSLANRLFLRRKFFTTQMAEGDNVLAHITKVRTMADKLEAVGAGIEEEDTVMTLLCSLPESYGSLITALESRAEDLTLEFVAARLLHEEQKRLENHTMDSNTRETAFQVHTYPGDENIARKPRPSTQYPCHYCGKVGHWKRECKKRMADLRSRSPQANTVTETGDADCVLMCDNTCNEHAWYLDSGASKHVTFQRERFTSYATIKASKIYLGDNFTCDAIGKGTVEVCLKNDNGDLCKYTLVDVLHVPGLAKNLLSVSQITDKGFDLEFRKSGAVIKDANGKVIARGIRKNNLYELACCYSDDHISCNFADVRIDTKLWHERMGHINLQSLKMLCRHNMVLGLKLDETQEDVGLCEGCVQGKQPRQSFPTDGASRATQLLGIVHTDICGPMKNVSLGGKNYFLTFTDDFSRKTYVYFLKHKSEAFAMFKEFKAVAENWTGHQVKVLRSDNGGEYNSTKFDEYCKECGIVHQLSTPYTPQQNGVAERLNRTLEDSARSMLLHHNVDPRLWAEAVATAVYIKNRSYTRALNRLTPEEIWSGRKPTVSHLRVFGCDAYAHVPDECRTKFDPKSKKCIFVGYSEVSKAYRLYNPESRRLTTSRDVTFNESVSSFRHLSHVQQSGPIYIEQEDRHVPAVGFNEQGQQIAMEEQVVHQEAVTMQQETIPEACSGEEEPESIQEPEHNVATEQEATPLRRSAREHRNTGEWWKVGAAQVEHACVAQELDPDTVEEALASEDAPKWQEALDEEFKSLQKNKTWSLMALPAGSHAIGCKWVLKKKYNADGSIARHKARLVAKGFSQTHGIDYNETFAPVAKFTSIRTLLAIAAHEDMEVHQMDVKTAFLNGDIQEDIYMVQPEGFAEPGKERLVCQLKKALYGLKQAPRAWYERINNFLLGVGFNRLDSDYSVYVLRQGDAKTMIAIHVDDLIMISSSVEQLQSVKGMLCQEFEMTDMGPIAYCLGIQIKRDRKNRSISLSQSKYVEDVLKRYGMEQCYPIGTPQDASVTLSKSGASQTEEEVEYMQKVPYQQAVGSLMYAMVGTRPDLAVAVGDVCQFMSNPGVAHWNAVNRIFRYLKGTIDTSLTYCGGSLKLMGYSDANWGGDKDTRRSTTGYMFKLGGGAVSWNSKRQPTVALSTTEAEYMALTQCTKEAVWLKRLLCDLHYHQVGPIEILEDNQGCMALAKNPVSHARTKHIDIQHHFIREKVQSGEVELRYCRSAQMPADLLTKALTKEAHFKFMDMMGLKLQQQSISC